MSNEQLKPCPFCGGDAEITSQGDHRKSHIVSCTNCGCDHESGDRDFYSNSSWNRRDVKSQWISVDERLPEDGQIVLMMHSSPHNAVVGYLHKPSCRWMAEGEWRNAPPKYWQPIDPIPTIEDK